MKFLNKIDGADKLIQDSNNRLVTDTKINEWDNAEQNAKNYTDSELVAHAKNATLNQLGHVNHAVLTTTLNTSWSGSSAPYTKTISVSGILSTDVPFIDIVMSGTYATDTARQEAWRYIYRAITADNAITFYATDKPTVSLPLQIKVLR